MPSLNLRLLAACAVVSLIATGCGGSGPKAAAKSADSSSPSASSTQQLDQTVETLRKRIHDRGFGRFTQTTRDVSGKVTSSVNGQYSTKGRQLTATIRVPDSASARTATGRVQMLGKRAFLQVDQWKKPARSCWLATTPQTLSATYLLDLAGSDDLPLAVHLIDDFVPASNSGGGVVAGTIPIGSVLPLLSGELKQQLVSAKPQGDVEAFLTIDGDDVVFTVPGYALSKALSTSLRVDEAEFVSIQGQRFETALHPAARVATLAAPPKAKQMSLAQLKSNRC